MFIFFICSSPVVFVCQGGGVLCPRVESDVFGSTLVPQSSVLTYNSNQNHLTTPLTTTIISSAVAVTSTIPIKTMVCLTCCVLYMEKFKLAYIFVMVSFIYL